MIESPHKEFFKVDLRNKDNLEEIFHKAKKANQPIEAVIHFAGLKSISESTSKPLDYWDNNLIGTINLLQVMNKFNCKTIVFSSSASIYQTSNKKSLVENDLINPLSAYGETKFTIEKVLSNIYFSSREWKIANLRYFNPISSHESGLIGEDPQSTPNNIYPRILQVAFGNLKEIQIYGNDWPTKDGTAVRDYIHVMDLAEGHIAALEALTQSENKIINLNLGTGKGTSVLELVNTFEMVNNIKIPYEIANRREGDCPTVIADNSLALSYLDWEPKRSLEDMCLDGWKWQSLNPEGYN